MAQTKPVEAVKAVTPVEAKPQLQEWGPYADYLIVSTPHGDFGLEPQHIMRLELQESYNPKTHSTVQAMLPVYEKVHIDDDRLKPGVAGRR